MKKLLSTKEAAQFLGVNEKMIYTLIAEKRLPATRVTGKWLFPQHLIEQWVEVNTLNYPEPAAPPAEGKDLLVIAGSNDPLLDRALSLFNASHPERIAVFGNLGSMGGVRALRRNLCHMASSHLLQEDETEYNFDFAAKELERMPAVVSFCRREQGILVAQGNPKGISTVADLGAPGIRVVNRPPGTGTRLLLDRELGKAGIDPSRIEGYDREFSRHLDVGIEILSGRADAGPAIRAIAGLLGLGFIPLRWERFDLMISKERFFDQGVQLFIGMLHDPEFRKLAEYFAGYETADSGKMVYPAAPA